MCPDDESEVPFIVYSVSAWREGEGERRSRPEVEMVTTVKELR